MPEVNVLLLVSEPEILIAALPELFHTPVVALIVMSLNEWVLAPEPLIFKVPVTVGRLEPGRIAVQPGMEPVDEQAV